MWDIITGMGEGALAMAIIAVLGFLFVAVLAVPGMLRDRLKERRHQRERRNREWEREWEQEN